MQFCVFLDLMIVFSQFKPDECQEDGEEGEHVSNDGIPTCSLGLKVLFFSFSKDSTSASEAPYTSSDMLKRRRDVNQKI